MTNYERGARLERDVLRDFEDHGYIAIRAAGSHTPADVYAFRKGEKNVFVQCKTNGKLAPLEWNLFWKYCKQADAIPILAERNRGIKYHLLTGMKLKRGAQPYREWSID